MTVTSGQNAVLAADETAEPVEWTVSAKPVDYGAAVASMEDRCEAIRTGARPELVWLLEHPPLYTAGTSAHDNELLRPDRFPVYRTGRGGRYTYHGPGQRVVYLMLDLSGRGKDVRSFVKALETWVIMALARFGVEAGTRDGRIGVWVRDRNGSEAKIAAVGVRIRRWVTYHGIAVNVDPDLSHFDGIVPCGLHGAAVTSLRDLGLQTSLEEFDTELRKTFARCFGSRLRVTTMS